MKEIIGFLEENDINYAAIFDNSNGYLTISDRFSVGYKHFAIFNGLSRSDVMLKETLKTLYRRDLEKLKVEISSYKKEDNLWLTEKDVSNSAGNLTLHLIGNLNTYFGAEIGKTGYVRYRDLEFSNKNTPRSELLEKIDEVILVVENALDSLTDEQFREIYPLDVFGYEMTTEYFLVHLTTHLAYHLGQINYHRRLLDI